MSTKLPGYEKTVICPYNKSHVILQHRIQTHLIKCEKQHPHIKLETCPFDITHRFPVEEKNVRFIFSTQFFLLNSFHSCESHVIYFCTNRCTLKNVPLETISIAMCTALARVSHRNRLRQEMNHSQNERSKTMTMTKIGNKLMTFIFFLNRYLSKPNL